MVLDLQEEKKMDINSLGSLGELIAALATATGTVEINLGSNGLGII